MAASIDDFTHHHRAKHLLSHVLSAAGARHWTDVSLGRSGETKTGFFADFSFPPLPSSDELSLLADKMAAILNDAREFREIDLSPAAALARFQATLGNAFKLKHSLKQNPR